MNINDTQSQPRDIMQYESKIWEVADLLLSAGIKQSDFPAYMMPFFALVMVEGRMINTIKRVEAEQGITANDDVEAFKALYDAEDCGYNEYIVMQGKTLKSICKNDTTFEQDFPVYLHEFDDVLKQLLGIEREKTDQKFLSMDGIVAELRKKGILLEVVSAWPNIDLAPYNNSAITTLEEHIMVLNTQSLENLDGMDSLVKESLNILCVGEHITFNEKRMHLTQLLMKYEVFLKKLYYLINNKELENKDPSKNATLSSAIFGFSSLRNLKYATNEGLKEFNDRLDIVRQLRNQEAHGSVDVTEKEVDAAIKVVIDMYLFAVGTNITELEMAGHNI